jgi:hypothetical protein
VFVVGTHSFDDLRLVLNLNWWLIAWLKFCGALFIVFVVPQNSLTDIIDWTTNPFSD